MTWRGAADEIAEARIGAIIEARVDAIRRGDAQALSGGFMPGAVVFEMVGPLRLPAGAASDAASIAGWLSSWQAPPDVEVRDLEIHVSGDVAFASSLNRLTGTRLDGRAVDLWMRSTLGFRLDGEWRIVHAHTSVPFRADASLQASLDLKPE